jgi:hypothetical protein
VSDDNRRAAAFVPNDFSSVAREIMQRQTLHRPTAAARATWLRPHNAKAGFGDPCSDLGEILRATAARRQQYDQRPDALSDGLDAHVIVGDDFPDTLSLGCDSAQYDQTGRNSDESDATQDDASE